MSEHECVKLEVGGDYQGHGGTRKTDTEKFIRKLI